MQSFAAQRGRSIIIVIILLALLISISLLLHGKIYLISALLCGYITAAYYFFMLATRIKKLILLSGSVRKPHRQTGILLRILFMLLLLLIMINLSKEIFIFFIAGFSLMYIVIFINLIIFSYHKKNY